MDVSNFYVSVSLLPEPDTGRNAASSVATGTGRNLAGLDQGTPGEPCVLIGYMISHVS